MTDVAVTAEEELKQQNVALAGVEPEEEDTSLVLEVEYHLPVRPPDDPEDFISEMAIEIHDVGLGISTLLPEKASTLVGVLHAALIYHHDFDVFDAHSQSAADIHAKLYTPSGELKVPCEMEGCGPVLWLQAIQLVDAYRGMDFGLKIAWALMNRFDGSLVILEACPLEASSETAREKGAVALRRYWARLGFKPVPEAKYLMYLDPARVQPNPFER